MVIEHIVAIAIPTFFLVVGVFVGLGVGSYFRVSGVEEGSPLRFFIAPYVSWVLAVLIACLPVILIVEMPHKVTFPAWSIVVITVFEVWWWRFYGAGEPSYAESREVYMETGEGWVDELFEVSD